MRPDWTGRTATAGIPASRRRVRLIAIDRPGYGELTGSIGDREGCFDDIHSAVVFWDGGCVSA